MTWRVIRAIAGDMLMVALLIGWTMAFIFRACMVSAKDRRVNPLFWGEILGIVFFAWKAIAG